MARRMGKNRRVRSLPLPRLPISGIGRLFSVGGKPMRRPILTAIPLLCAILVFRQSPPKRCPRMHAADHSHGTARGRDPTPGIPARDITNPPRAPKRYVTSSEGSVRATRSEWLQCFSDERHSSGPQERGRRLQRWLHRCEAAITRTVSIPYSSNLASLIAKMPSWRELFLRLMAKF